MPTLARRRVLIGIAAVAALAGVPAWLKRRGGDAAVTAAPAAPPQPATPPAVVAERFAQPLRFPMPPALGGEIALDGPIELVAREGRFAVFGDAQTAVWHYAAHRGDTEFANPLLSVKSGKPIDVDFVNALTEDSTIHWHGLLVDEANDGSGLHPVAPGERKHYRFTVRNRAGLYWYHAHPHGRTGAQVQRGLAGLLRIDDDEEIALRKRLGLVWGVRDLPLAIADKQVDANHAIVYPDAGADDWIGNRVLVNWTPEPHLDVQPLLYRLRIANTANARLWRLAFLHQGRSLPFRLIGTDGGLLDRAWTVEDIFLAPAQRIDVLVDFGGLPAGERVLLRSLDYVAMENEDESGAFAPDPMGDHPGAMPMGAALDLMEFRVGAGPGAPPTAYDHDSIVPERLSSLPRPPDTKDWPVRPFRLRMDAEGNWFINDWNFLRDGHEPAFRVKRGSREVWEIRNNMTSMPHPIHLHGFQFRVVSRAISPMDVRARQVAPNGLTPQDMGCNDTVLIWPGEVVRIAIDFSQPSRGVQRYMLHCHNLEHEDKGMMLTFAVGD